LCSVSVLSLIGRHFSVARFVSFCVLFLLPLLSVCVSIGGCCCLLSCFALLFVCVCVCVFVVQCFCVVLILFDLIVSLFCALLNHAPLKYFAERTIAKGVTEKYCIMCGEKAESCGCNWHLKNCCCCWCMPEEDPDEFEYRYEDFLEKSERHVTAVLPGAAEPEAETAA